MIRPSAEHPASQYFDSVQRGSVADKAGLRTGDFLLEVCSLQFHIIFQYSSVVCIAQEFRAQTSTKNFDFIEVCICTLPQFKFSVLLELLRICFCIYLTIAVRQQQ